MKFSLLMPTLCRSSLPAAIAAVRAQTWEHWELLISPTCDMPPSEDDRIRIVPRPSPNICDVLNYSISVATGDVFAMVADDDLLDPVALSAVATYLRSNPWLVGRTRTDGNITGGPCSFQQLLHANSIPLPAVFWTRDSSVATGDLDPAHEFCFDWDYWIRMWRACGAPRFIEHVLAEYVDHPGRVTHVHAEAVRLDAEAVKLKHRGGRDPENFDDCSGTWNGIMVNHVYCDHANGVCRIDEAQRRNL